ncbi:MAG: SAM-dependent chlorinase/fluorinase [Clostridia bacterium]|nr:SAM-dependent chlorinase/fluorinase [Deltaproteobacteria bacterium]
MGIVTLTTDFGSGSPYVAQMKGVLLSASRDLVLVDIAHNLPPYAIADAELLLRSTAFAFPLGSVHIVVVDPGVGSERRGIAVEANGCFFVGPDNGVLGAVASCGSCVSLDKTFLHRTPSASTFHGRDIFAPVAAELALGLTLLDVGSLIADPVKSTLPVFAETDTAVRGLTLGADRYGNLLTNIPARFVAAQVSVGGISVSLVRTYAEAAVGALVALVGSDGYLEIACREASAAERLGAVRGTEVVCHCA